MSREILFRAKRDENGEWVLGRPLYLTSEINENDKFALIVPLGTKFGCGELDEFYAVTPQTIGQFIGLTDKNGNKIFEGDIVMFENYDKHTFVCEITYIKEVAQFAISAICKNKHIGLMWDFVDADLEKIEVIGNKWDNPELLQEK